MQALLKKTWSNRQDGKPAYNIIQGRGKRVIHKTGKGQGRQQTITGNQSKDENHRKGRKHKDVTGYQYSAICVCILSWLHTRRL